MLKLIDLPDVNGKYLCDGDPDHGAVAEVEEEDVGHEEGERQPPDVGGVRPRALRHGPVQALLEVDRQALLEQVEVQSSLIFQN